MKHRKASVYESCDVEFCCMLTQTNLTNKGKKQQQWLLKLLLQFSPQHFSSDSKSLGHTGVNPSPPGLNESYPERTFCQQSNSEVRENLIVEDGQTAVVCQTSVDCSEPVHRISVNLVTRRVVHNFIVTARFCAGKINTSSAAVAGGPRSYSCNVPIIANKAIVNITLRPGPVLPMVGQFVYTPRYQICTSPCPVA